MVRLMVHLPCQRISSRYH